MRKLYPEVKKEHLKHYIDGHLKISYEDCEKMFEIFKHEK